jgi:8-oxo-dGTP pyrophosphatase MutT (NUDIX family)
MLAARISQALNDYLHQNPPVYWKIPENPAPRIAAILIALFREGSEWYLPFILRNTYDGVHSGQVAFPGGRYDTTDEDLIATALRETMEEIGVPVSRSQVVGQLHKLYIPPSHTIVHPIVALLPNPPVFNPDPHEVAEVFTLPVSYLKRPDIRGVREIALPNGNKTPFTTFRVAEKKEIWGATARMLTEFLAAIQSVL